MWYHTTVIFNLFKHWNATEIIITDHRQRWLWTLHKYDLRFIQIQGTLWQVAYLGAGAPQGCSGCRSLQSLPISETSGKVWSKSAAWTTFCLHPSPSHSISFWIFHQKCTGTLIFRHASVSSTYPCPSVRWSHFRISNLWSPYLKS